MASHKWSPPSRRPGRVFNSSYNRSSFLDLAAELLRRMPGQLAPTWVESIAERSCVLPFPIDLPDVPPSLVPPSVQQRSLGPTIAWNHRWEFDKDPDTFFATMTRLADEGVPFRLIVCGQSFRRTPPVFERSRKQLAARLVHFGSVAGRSDYLNLLRSADVVVSTARHEFFGVAVIEAVHLGARPMVPDRLAYPELWPAEYRWRDPDELFVKLRQLCRDYVCGKDGLRADRRGLTRSVLAPVLIPTYKRLLADPATF